MKKVKNMRGQENSWRGYPSLVGGRPAKPVVRKGRAGSNPAPRAKNKSIFKTFF